MAPRTRSLAPRSILLSASLVAFVASVTTVAACSHDWDLYAPSPGQTSSSGATGGASTSATTTASSSAGEGGAGGGSGGSGGSVERGIPCGQDGFVPLHEAFDGGIPADTMFPQQDPTAPTVNIDDQKGAVSIVLPLDKITWGGVVLSKDFYDLKNCSVAVQATRTPSDPGVYMNLVVKLDPDKNYVELTCESGKLQFKYTIDGVTKPVPACSAPCTGNSSLFWRIHVDAGITYWESLDPTKSPAAWTKLCQSDFPFPYAKVQVGFGAGTSSVGTITDGGATTERVTFDNLDNLP